MAEGNPFEVVIYEESVEVENVPEYVEGYGLLSNLLKKLQLERLLPFFIEEEVDDDFILRINMDNEIDWNLIASLLPTIGSKGKFRLALKELQVRKMLSIFPILRIGM